MIMRAERVFRIPLMFHSTPSFLKIRIIGIFVNQGRGTQMGSVRRYLDLPPWRGQRGEEHRPIKNACTGRRLYLSLNLQ